MHQVIDITKTNQTLFNSFIDSLFSKFFRGRNLIIKSNDIKNVFKFTLSSQGINYYLNKLLPYLSNKEEGGARTAHQLNQVINIFIIQVFHLMTYVFEIYSSKNKDEDKKFEGLEDLIKNLKNAIKSNLKEEKVDKRKVNLFYAGLIQLVEKLINILKISSTETKSEDEIKLISSLVKNIEQVITSQEIKQFIPRIEKIKAKLV